MKIHLIRHGQTTGDLEFRFGGDYDDELTELGLSQAAELIVKLSGKGIKKIYHSPKLRAVQTAEILGRAINVSLIELENLREKNSYGVLSGLTDDEAKLKYPQELNNVKKYRHSYNVLGSEDKYEFIERVNEAMKSILEDKEDIAVISHGGVIRAFCRSLKLGEISKLGDCAMIEFEKIDDVIEVKSTDGVEFSKVEIV